MSNSMNLYIALIGNSFDETVKTKIVCFESGDLNVVNYLDEIAKNEIDSDEEYLISFKKCDIKNVSTNKESSVIVDNFINSLNK